MLAGPSGAAFVAVARDSAIRADGIPDRLSMVARLRYGLKRLYEPIMDGLPDRFSYLLMLVDRSRQIESDYLLSRHLSGLEMEIGAHCCFVQPAR
jgi:hypothetical protein